MAIQCFTSFSNLISKLCLNKILLSSLSFAVEKIINFLSCLSYKKYYKSINKKINLKFNE